MTEQSPNPLPRRFFDRPTLKVAQDLLGKFLIRETSNGLLHARIVDVEAYIGPEDKACHASKGRTKRTEIMFGPPGFTYVYLIYGMYYCLNLVTEREEFPAAILVRGLEVYEETDAGMASARIDGPGRVCRFLEINRADNGVDATLGSTLWIEDRSLNHTKTHIQSLPRIGIDYAGEWAHKLWRFCLPAPPSPGKRRTSLR
jgi:DNA-3-methyladenine glycosylase